MRTPTGFLEWVAENPKDTGVDGEAKPSSWAGKCVAHVRRAGDFPASNTATTAQRAHDLTVRNGHPMALVRDVPRGWFVYFSGPTSDGHVGMSTGDGGFCSATSFLPNAVGVMPIEDYARKPRVTFLGASPYFINLRLEPDPKPAPDEPKGNDMKYIYKTEGGTAWAIIDSNLTAGYLQTTVLAEAEMYSRVCPTSAVLVTASAFAASITAAGWYKTQCPTGSGGGGLTVAEHNQLFNIPNKAETTALHTAQTGDINSHTTDAVNGITLTSTP